MKKINDQIKKKEAQNILFWTRVWYGVKMIMEWTWIQLKKHCEGPGLYDMTWRTWSFNSMVYFNTQCLYLRCQKTGNR